MRKFCILMIVFTILMSACSSDVNTEPYVPQNYKEVAIQPLTNVSVKTITMYLVDSRPNNDFFSDCATCYLEDFFNGAVNRSSNSTYTGIGMEGNNENNKTNMPNFIKYDSLSAVVGNIKTDLDTFKMQLDGLEGKDIIPSELETVKKVAGSYKNLYANQQLANKFLPAHMLSSHTVNILQEDSTQGIAQSTSFFEYSDSQIDRLANSMHEEIKDYAARSMKDLIAANKLVEELSYYRVVVKKKDTEEVVFDQNLYHRSVYPAFIHLNNALGTTINPFDQTQEDPEAIDMDKANTASNTMIEEVQSFLNNNIIGVAKEYYNTAITKGNQKIVEAKEEKDYYLTGLYIADTSIAAYSGLKDFLTQMDLSKGRLLQDKIGDGIFHGYMGGKGGVAEFGVQQGMKPIAEQQFFEPLFGDEKVPGSDITIAEDLADSFAGMFTVDPAGFVIAYGVYQKKIQGYLFDKINREMGIDTGTSAVKMTDEQIEEVSDINNSIILTYAKGLTGMISPEEASEQINAKMAQFESLGQEVTKYNTALRDKKEYHFKDHTREYEMSESAKKEEDKINKIYKQAEKEASKNNPVSSEAEGQDTSGSKASCNLGDLLERMAFGKPCE